MNIHVISFLLVISSAIMTSGCSTSTAPVSDNKPGTIKREAVKEIQTGMVTHVKEVTVLADRRSYGRMAGSTIGSVAGGSVGSGWGSVAGSVFGRVIGGAVGASADENAQKKPGLEITVRLDNGQHVTVTQLKTETSFQSGQRVKLVMNQGKAVVEPAS